MASGARRGDIPMARQDSARAGGARSNLYDDITNKIIGELEDGRLTDGRFS